MASIADSTGNTMNFVYTSGVITELDRAATVTDYYSYDSAGRLTGDGNDYQRVFGDSSTNYCQVGHLPSSRRVVLASVL